MRIATVYKITSPTGRVYIGSTITKMHVRMAYYRRLECKTQIKLYNSLLKYGFEAHTIEIVETCDSVNRNFRETFWGMRFDVLGENGLNCLLPKCEEYGGISNETRERFKNRPCSEATKARLRVNFLGMKHTPEAIEKCRVSKLGNKHTLGWKPTDENLANMSKAQKGRIVTAEQIEKRKATIAKNGLTQKEILSRLNHPYSKLVVNTETGIYYDSTKEAERYSVYKKDQLRQMLNGQRKNKSPYIYA